MAVVFLKSKKPVDLFDPERKNILISDISYSLSTQSRFQGGPDKFISEAERCIVLCKRCRQVAKETYKYVDPEFQKELVRLASMDGLMYHSSNAYLGVIPENTWMIIDSRFGKHNALRFCETVVKKIIYQKLVKDHIPDSVRKITLYVDEILTRTEKYRYQGYKLSENERVYNDKTIAYKGLSPKNAQKQFIKYYKNLVSY